MPKITELVAEQVQTDPVLWDALARGIVNYRGLARWLIRTHGWDASEIGVMSAIRRWNQENHSDAFSPAQRALSAANLTSRSHMCQLQLRNEKGVNQAVPKVFQAIDFQRGDILRILTSDRGLRVIVDERNIKQTVEILGRGNIERTRHGLTELSMVIPPESWDTPGVLALLCNRLALKKINIVGFVDGVDQLILLVRERDALEAYRLLVKFAQVDQSDPAVAPDSTSEDVTDLSS